MEGLANGGHGGKGRGGGGGEGGGVESHLGIGGLGEVLVEGSLQEKAVRLRQGVQSLLENRWWDPPEDVDAAPSRVPQKQLSSSVRQIDEHALAVSDVLRGVAAASHQSVGSAIDNVVEQFQFGSTLWGDRDPDTERTSLPLPLPVSRPSPKGGSNGHLHYTGSGGGGGQRSILSPYSSPHGSPRHRFSSPPGSPPKQLSLAPAPVSLADDLLGGAPVAPSSHSFGFQPGGGSLAGDFAGDGGDGIKGGLISLKPQPAEQPGEALQDKGGDREEDGHHRHALFGHFHHHGSEHRAALPDQLALIEYLRREMEEMEAEAKVHEQAIGLLDHNDSEVLRPKVPYVPAIQRRQGEWFVQGHVDDPSVQVVLKARVRGEALGMRKKNQRLNLRVCNCYTRDVTSARVTMIRCIGDPHRMIVSDCSGISILVDAVTREVTCIRCHLCTIVVGGHMPFVSLDSCSDCTILSSVVDEEGQMVETVKCSGINLRIFDSELVTAPSALLTRSVEAKSVWLPDELLLNVRGNIVACRSSFKYGRPVDERPFVVQVAVEYLTSDAIMSGRTSVNVVGPTEEEDYADDLIEQSEALEALHVEAGAAGGSFVDMKKPQLNRVTTFKLEERTLVNEDTIFRAPSVGEAEHGNVGRQMASWEEATF